MSTDARPNRRLYVSMIVSADGFIEGPDRELDWFENDDPDFERYCDEMVDSVGLALYGRRSYELMLDYWPNAEKNPRSPQDLAFARKMNALPKRVLSRTLERAEWNNTRVIGDRVEATIAWSPGCARARYFASPTSYRPNALFAAKRMRWAIASGSWASCARAMISVKAPRALRSCESRKRTSAASIAPLLPSDRSMSRDRQSINTALLGRNPAPPQSRQSMGPNSLAPSPEPMQL